MLDSFLLFTRFQNNELVTQHFPKVTKMSSPFLKYHYGLVVWCIAVILNKVQIITSLASGNFCKLAPESYWHDPKRFRWLLCCLVWHTVPSCTFPPPDLESTTSSRTSGSFNGKWYLEMRVFWNSLWWPLNGPFQNGQLISVSWTFSCIFFFDNFFSFSTFFVFVLFCFASVTCIYLGFRFHRSVL